MKTWCVLVMAVVACTRRNPDVCNSDADCKMNDPAKPFCDVDGTFGSPTTNTCIATPMNCPPERCGCTPGATTCAMDQLSVCNPDGRSATTTNCGLGCATDGTRCLSFQPLNGLDAALMQAGGEPDIALPAGATFDTGTGAVTDSTGGTIAVRSLLVPQGATSIRAFIGKSFVVDNSTITGPNAFALVSPGTISVKGLVVARGHGTTGGPGSVVSGSLCVGNSAAYGSTGYPGAGGAGNATAGGAGGGAHATTTGGTTVSTFVPLVGGCSGGAITGSTATSGGGGGGAVQIVSLQQVAFQGSGLIHVGAGGGGAWAGGGSGGNIIIEAPMISFDPSTGVTANGGAGGCDASGADAAADLSPAPSTTCSNTAFGSSGAGGTGSALPGNGTECVTMFCLEQPEYAGGGGAAGRLLLRSRTGGDAPPPLLSAAFMVQMLTAQ